MNIIIYKYKVYERNYIDLIRR